MKYVGTGTNTKNPPKWLVMVLAFFFGVFGLHDLIIRENRKALAHFLLFLIPKLISEHNLPYFALEIYLLLILVNWIWAIVEAVKYDPTRPKETAIRKSLSEDDKRSSALVNTIKTARAVTYANIVITAPIWLILLMGIMGLRLDFLGHGAGTVIALVFLPVIIFVSIVLFAISLVPFFLMIPKKNRSYELVNLEFRKFEIAFSIGILPLVFIVIFMIF